MKFFQFIFYLSFLICQSLIAQDGLHGRLEDQNKESIPFATISFIKLPDSTVVTGTTTDLEGKFQLTPSETGKYILKYSAIGYSPWFSEEFQVNGKGFSKNFGVIRLEEETTMLDDVLLKTWKQRVKVESDRLVMNVGGTALAAGNTAYELLSRAPGVSAGPGGFLINGKTGVLVMINDRQTYLSSAELNALLESMPAENIKEIEVIHSPSAKHDAEGVAGILNIKLKKNADVGLNGSVYGGFQYNQLQLFNGGVNLNYRKDNWNTFLILDLAQRGYIRDQHQYRIFAGEEEPFLDQLGEETSKSFVPSLRLGTDLDINDGHSLGLMASLGLRKRDNNWNTLTDLGSLGAGAMLHVDARNKIDDEFRNGRFNLHYTWTPDTSGTSLSADLDYVRVERDQDSRFKNQYTDLVENSEKTENISNNSISGYDIYAAKLDLFLPLSEDSSLEFGAKASKVSSNSELEFYLEENGNPVLDPERSDHFNYDENIYAAYASYANQINDTWKLQLGLRAEQTFSEANSYSMDQQLSRDYLEFFPNLLVEQKLSENYQLNYSFTRRLSRPNYTFLNPFIFYLDPYTYIVGNPDLRPQFTNSFQISQSLFKKFNLRLSYDLSKDYMGEVPSMDPETRETVFTTRNMKKYRTYGATLVAPVELSSFWNINNTLVLNRELYELEINQEPQTRENYYFLAQSNHQINLPLEIKMELNGTYRARMYYGVYDIAPQYWVDAGLKKSFLDEKLDVSLRASDIFKTMHSEVEADFLGNHYQMKQYFGNRAISINLRYNFSKGNSKKKARATDTLEEMSRAGVN